MQALQDCNYAMCLTPSTNLGNMENILNSGNHFDFNAFFKYSSLFLIYLYKSQNFINSFESLT